MTTTPTLTDRYLYALERATPERDRAGIAAEVRERIADAIDARIAAGASPDAAERAALDELGDPDRLAADYLGRTLQLIGPKYYLAWWRLLRILLVTVLPSTAGALVLANAIAGRDIGEIIGGAIWVTIVVGVNLCFWTTLAFALVDRYGVRPLPALPGLPSSPRLRGLSALDPTGSGAWSVDQLPVPAPAETRVSRGQAIASGVFAVIVALAIVVQQFNPFLHDAAGAPIPLLDPSLWSLALPYLLGIVALHVAITVATYLQGRYAWWTAVANAIVNLAITIPGIWLWSTGALVNPAFVEAVGIDRTDTVRIVGIVGGLVWAGVAGWDIVDGFLRAARTERAVGGRR